MYRSQLLHVLSEDEKHRLWHRSHPFDSRGGDFLFLTGDEPETVFLVLHGLVKLMARDLDGRLAILGLIGPGDVVGTVAALDGGSHPVDAVTVGRCFTRMIPTDELVRLTRSNPDAGTVVGRSLARQVRWLYEVTVDRRSGDIHPRLAARLLELADLVGRTTDEGIRIEAPMPQRELAALAGMCRETACRAIGSFKRAGAVDYQGRTLRILRRDVLERIRCAGRGVGPYR